jgi:hypothetical protein
MNFVTPDKPRKLGSLPPYDGEELPLIALSAKVMPRLNAPLL